MSPKPSILMVVARYLPLMGGTETHTHEVARRLVSNGYRVAVLTTDRGDTLPPHEWDEGVEIIRVRAWPARRDYYVAPAIYRVVGSRRWDIVHCQGYHTLVAPLAMLAARRTGVPFVLTLHSGGHSNRLRTLFRGFHRWLLRPLLVDAARIIGVSRFEADLFRESLRLRTDRFTVIPNGAALTLETGASSRKRDQPLIISVGRVERYKGHHRIIQALPYIQAEYPDVRLRILGRGPYEKALRQLAHRVGVEDRVEIAAVPAADREAMAMLLREAWLVTLFSEYEAHAIAVLEAVSVGTPALVADTTGLHELVESGLARGISIRSTPQQIAAAVSRELANPLGVDALRLPTWEDCVSQLMALYGEVAAPAVTRAPDGSQSHVSDASR